MRPTAIVINDSGTLVYVVDMYTNKVSVIGTATHAVLATLREGETSGAVGR